MKFNILLLVLVFPQLIIGQTTIENIILNQNENYIKVVSKSSSGLTLEISIGNFNKIPVSIEGKKFYMTSLINESFIKEKGNPELPKIVRSIIIPSNSNIKDSIIKSEYIDIDLPIIPSKGILSRIVNPDDIPYTFSSSYLNNEFIPKNRIEFGEPYLIRNVRGNAITIFPFAYNPVSKKLRIYTKLVITISFCGLNLKNAINRVSTENNKYFESIFKNQFLNYDSETILKRTSAIDDETGRMLIIASDPFMRAMQPFVKHKNNRGLPTQIVRMSEVGSTAENVYSYIKANYDNDNSLTFVLLVGDNAQIPTKIVSSGGSDPSFSLLSGSDNYPDIIVGRFSAETEAQVTTMVNRTITYENTSEQSWFNAGICIGSSLGPGDDNEYDYVHERNIRTSLLGYHYTSISELYDGSQGVQDVVGNPTPAMVSSAINNGASIINYTGHGTNTSWGTSCFSNTEVNALTNDNKLPFIFSVACVNGDFTENTCFAESWLRAINSSTGNPVGAIAFYGSSINQDWDPPMEAQDQFNALLISNTYSSFGALCYNASWKMMDAYGAGNGQKGANLFLTWNVFGDPSVSVIPNTMSCPLTLISGTINSSHTYNGCKINVVNATITNNANVIFDAIQSTKINGPFEVQIGSTLEIK